MVIALLLASLGLAVVPTDTSVTVTNDEAGIDTVVDVSSPIPGGRETSASGGSPVCTWLPDEALNELLAGSGRDADLGRAYAAGGRFYDLTCSDGSLTMGIYLDGAPTKGATAGELIALSTRNRLPLPAPRPMHNPPGPALVNLPTWWWIDARDWHVLRQQTRAGSLAVQVTARPSLAVWDPGDGETPLSCAGPGTTFNPRRPAGTQRSRCFHTYRVGNATADGRGARGVRVEVTVTWLVTWTANDGTGGALPPLRRRTSFRLPVVERRAVVTGTRD